MNFRPPRERELEINLTPLIDVVFLLPIFFMVSTTFIKDSQIKLTLPDASPTAPEQLPDAIRVAIDSRGNVYVDDRPLVNRSVKTIRGALHEAREGREDPLVIISADAASTHQVVVDVMDAARQEALFRLTFPTRHRAQDD